MQISKCSYHHHKFRGIGPINIKGLDPRMVLYRCKLCGYEDYRVPTGRLR